MSSPTKDLGMDVKKLGMVHFEDPVVGNYVVEDGSWLLRFSTHS